jgi:hypothetical protein
MFSGISQAFGVISNAVTSDEEPNWGDTGLEGPILLATVAARNHLRGNNLLSGLSGADRDRAIGNAFGQALWSLMEEGAGVAGRLSKLLPNSRATKVLDVLEDGCFVAGTLVKTDKGLVPIEDIEKGDVVLSKNQKTGELQWSVVNNIYRTIDREVGMVTIFSKSGDTESLGATPGHPFLVMGKGWVAARQLERGDLLFSPNNGWVKVSSGSWVSRRQTVYNLHVDINHSYFIGEIGILVHNNSEETWGRLISRNHGRDHLHDFPDVLDMDDFADMIDGIVNNPDDFRRLRNGREAFWSDDGIVVITDPNNPHGGSVYRPDTGKEYFYGLR